MKDEEKFEGEDEFFSTDAPGQGFDDLLKKSLAKAGPRHLQKGEKIDAEVVKVGAETVFLDIGMREEGALPRPEVEGEGLELPKPGDRLTVYFVGRRDGVMTLTRRLGSGGAEDRKAGQDAVLAALRDAQEGGVPVEGTVKEVIKGGFSVTIMGQRAFCPISQIDKVYCETPEQHVNKTYTFVVTEFGEDGRNIVVSRRREMEREAAEKERELWQTLAEGTMYDGTVTSLQKYGAFVDIGGMEGLLHVSEISHARVGDPRDVLSVGQKLKVIVIKVDRETRKISLSLKTLDADPWVEAVDRFRRGSVVRGKVTRLMQFGAFVELSPGVEGLLHVSRMAEGRRVNNPREIVSAGQEISIEIVEFEHERRRISLALHDDSLDEEKAAAETYKLFNEGRKDSFGTLGDLLAKKIKK
ncbi:MAG: S1 RNA-binding domain-containing protein [Deltaproteobacteria bacterium]|nr:S1 RNA-binding domain-containing protein [Deltaproteobacteria bacterium]